jgi:hypothetical protein
MGGGGNEKNGKEGTDVSIPGNVCKESDALGDFSFLRPI